jgi:hypothetical protein
MKNWIFIFFALLIVNCSMDSDHFESAPSSARYVAGGTDPTAGFGGTGLFDPVDVFIFNAYTEISNSGVPIEVYVEGADGLVVQEIEFGEIGIFNPQLHNDDPDPKINIGYREVGDSIWIEQTVIVSFSTTLHQLDIWGHPQYEAPEQGWYIWDYIGNPDENNAKYYYSGAAKIILPRNW